MRYTGLIAFFVLLLLLVSCDIFAQQFVRGKIHKKESTEMLQAVTVRNFSREEFNLSDMGGNFRILADRGDTLIFSSAGYKSDTLVVGTFMLTDGVDVFLEPRVVALPTVRVGGVSNYQLDSIQRRKDYDWVYDHGKTKMLEKDRHGRDGVGIGLNIPTRSTADKQREKLKKRLIQEEEDYYIDSRFTRDYVTRLTKMQGDSLQTFMVRYRPSYEFCRTATNQDILLYINDSWKKFKTGG